MWMNYQINVTNLFWTEKKNRLKHNIGVKKKELLHYMCTTKKEDGDGDGDQKSKGDKYIICILVVQYALRLEI